MDDILLVKFWARPMLERRKTFGHLRSINRNMIITWQTNHRPANFWKLKKPFFLTFHEKKLWKVVQSIPDWTDMGNPYRLSRTSYIYIYGEFLAWNFYDLFQCISEFTGWAIIEELSIRRRLRTFRISWGQKTRVKHCYVDLSSWYELWFAIICIDMDVILVLSTEIQQF